MIYRVRTTRPRTSAWFEVDAPSPEDAAQDWHVKHVPSGAQGFNAFDIVESYVYRHEMSPHSLEIIYFALIEIEGHGERVSRIYRTGIWRMGRVKPAGQLTLKDIATGLGWTHGVQELLAPWEGEETWEEAKART